MSLAPSSSPSWGVVGLAHYCHGLAPLHLHQSRVTANSRVVAVVTRVLLVVQVLGLLLGLVLRSLLADKVHAPGFGELVYLGRSKAGDELLGETVVDALA